MLACFSNSSDWNQSVWSSEASVRPKCFLLKLKLHQGVCVHILDETVTWYSVLSAFLYVSLFCLLLYEVTWTQTAGTHWINLRKNVGNYKMCFCKGSDECVLCKHMYFCIHMCMCSHPHAVFKCFIWRGNKSLFSFVIVMLRGFASLPEIDWTNSAIQLCKDLLIFLWLQS